MTAKESWAERSLTLNVPQRRLLAGLFGIIVIYAGIRLAFDRKPISDPQPPRGDHWPDLADRLDPNTADWTELAALPAIGEKRAHAIVARREAIHTRDLNAIVYKEPRDLYYVSGFGVSMVEQLKQYMYFPGNATTQSSPTSNDLRE